MTGQAGRGGGGGMSRGVTGTAAPSVETVMAAELTARGWRGVGVSLVMEEALFGSRAAAERGVNKGCRRKKE